jgi:hypothetical protein
VIQVEMWPGEGAWFMKNAEQNAKIIRKVSFHSSKHPGRNLEFIYFVTGIIPTFHVIRINI